MFRSEIDERTQQLKLWIRRRGRKPTLVCSGCGRKVTALHEVYEREVQDLPCFAYRATIIVECHRVRCPACGLKVERTDGSLTQIFDGPVGGREFFEEINRDNPDRRRPDRVQPVFDRAVNESAKWVSA